MVGAPARRNLRSRQDDRIAKLAHTGQVKARYEDFEDLIDDVDLSEEVDGFHLGAGAEIGLGNNVYGKLEYVYTNYDGAEYADEGFSAGVDLDRHQLFAAVGIRF